MSFMDLTMPMAAMNLIYNAKGMSLYGKEIESVRLKYGNEALSVFLGDESVTVTPENAIDIAGMIIDTRA